MSLISTDTFDVIICGCGPTGALLSANLSRLGVNHVILERDADIATDPRGIAMDEDGIRIAQGVGIYEALFQDVGKREFPEIPPALDCTEIVEARCRQRERTQMRNLSKSPPDIFFIAMGLFQFIEGGRGLDVRPFLQFDYNTVSIF